VLDNLQKLMGTPLPQNVKVHLRPKRLSFAEIVQRIISLFAYKSLHESFLLLLITLNYNETLLANPDEQTEPNLESIARQMDNVSNKAPAVLALLSVVPPELNGWLTQLAPLAAGLRAAGTPDKTAAAIDNIQRSVRLALSWLNGKIFETVRELSFEPLIMDVPLEIEDRDEFKDLRQAVRDLMATVLARTLKHKMWQDAENQMSLLGSSLEVEGEAVGIADDWTILRTRVDWLAGLDPNEKWAGQADKHALEIDTEITKEGKLDDNLRMHFEAFRTWFKEPFKKMDEALTVDCGSLRKMDDPITKLLNELAK
jgi:hypothetical protein